jgi:meiotically up-regulated gene 157 (Mug157) protein
LINVGATFLRLEDHRQRQQQQTDYLGRDFFIKNNDMIFQLPLLPPSIWSTRKLSKPINITPLLSTNETQRAEELCGKFIYSTLQRAVRAGDMAEEVFVATGDIDYMWIRDSVVQMSSYLNHHMDKPWLRFLVEGAIRRNAFNIIQDPYANAYYHEWKDPNELSLKDRVIGRGGFVATRNYELDSGAYFLCHLYDYYMADDIYRPEALLVEPMIFEAVLLILETWIVEQHHEEQSPYRYFELPREGLGSETVFTGMTWTGFRPSDDACQYGYLIPANIHAAAALERILILNNRVWKQEELGRKATQLLNEIEHGIKEYGIITDENGERFYAYEVDGKGGFIGDFDDANIPSLLSIPLLGWTGYDHQVYVTTRSRILSSQNSYYFQGKEITGIGSPHTNKNYVWPMALVVQGLTEEGDDRAEKMAFQMKQLILSACRDSMHESVDVDNVCKFTRAWFEWANALFVLYTEATLDIRCDAIGSSRTKVKAAKVATDNVAASKSRFGLFYSNRYQNNPSFPEHYQGEAAGVMYDTAVSEADIQKTIRREIGSAITASEKRLVSLFQKDNNPTVFSNEQVPHTHNAARKRDSAQHQRKI